MRLFEATKDMNIEEMTRAIADFAEECARCGGGCISGDGSCLSCIESRLRDEVEK